MKKIIIINFLVFFIYFLLWILIDFIDVKWQRLPDFEYAVQFVLGIVFISFIRVNQKRFQKFPFLLRYLIISVISSFITALWVVISTFTVIHFHVVIGGYL